MTDILLVEGAGAPAMLYWDARIEPAAGDGEPAWLHFGRGGLDPVLAGEQELSRTVAISTVAFDQLMRRGAIKSAAEFPRAVTLLARSPGLRSLWCPGFAGVVDPAQRPSTVRPHGPATHAEGISLAILASDPSVSVEPFFAALASQAITSALDVLVVSVGHDSTALKKLVRAVEKAASVDTRFKVRRYSLGGAVSPAYLANVAVGLANHEVVVLADARCAPVTPNVVQRLADWALSGDAVAACPRVVHNRRLVAAGLALAGESGDSEALTPWDQAAASDGLRTAAAPAPWFFAARRAAWLSAGGLQDLSGELWTANFASARGPRGRTFLVGAEVVEWIGDGRPFGGEQALAHRNLQPFAATALRDPTPSTSAVEMPSGPSRLRTPVGESAEASGPVPSFSDPFPSMAETKILVFADAYGASQSIAFVEGLSQSRSSGSVAVRVLEEATFVGDSRTLDEVDVADLVEAQFRETEPDVVVASRLGRSAVWRALKRSADRRGTPIIFHLDDDLFDLPATLGIERYRLAHNPKRVRTLQEILSAADLVLAATPTLAARLRARAGHARILALEYGAAGRPARDRVQNHRADLVIGYMGSASHNHDLAMAVPAMNRIAADYDHVRFVLFGTIAEQPAAMDLQGPVDRFPPVLGDYREFRRRLADLRLDIGLAPLVDTAFNRAKTPTKWVEYAEAGVATLVSPVGPYIEMVEAGASLGARPDTWEGNLRRLVEHPGLRDDIVGRASGLLAARFGWDRLEDQVLRAFAEVVGRGRTP